MGKVDYILLDCDNTLAKSEFLAFEACTELSNEILEKHNIDHKYTVHQLLETFVGQNFRGMCVKLQEIHNFKMEPKEVDAYVDRELGAVTAKLSEKCEPCPGVPEMMKWIHDQGYKMSVVSTSAKPRVVASIKKIGIDWICPDEHVYSAATSLNPPSSKPDPKIYNYACEQLGVKNGRCVTVEDSKSGATAAMRAGIPLIAYVGIYGIEEGQEKMEKMAKLLKEECKATAVMYDWKEFPACLAEVEKSIPNL